MANGYRLEKDDLLKLGFELITIVEGKDFDKFYKEAWKFIFEIKIDLNTAVNNNDEQKEILYTNTISAISNLVERIIGIQDLQDILDK